MTNTGCQERGGAGSYQICQENRFFAGEFRRLDGAYSFFFTFKRSPSTSTTSTGSPSSRSSLPGASSAVHNSEARCTFPAWRAEIET